MSALERRLSKLEAVARSQIKPRVDLSRLTDAQLEFLADAQTHEIGIDAAFATLSDEELVSLFEALGLPAEPPPSPEFG